MGLENEKIDCNEALFEGYPDGLHGIMKNVEGETGFLSKGNERVEWIPVADGHDPSEAQETAFAYHELRINSVGSVEEGYINFVCQKVKSLALPKINK